MQGSGLSPGTYLVLTSEIPGTEEGFYKGFAQKNFMAGTQIGSVVVGNDGILSTTVKMVSQKSSTGCRYIWVGDFPGVLPGGSGDGGRPYSSPIWAQ